jgi:hypothetical protein
MGETDLLPDPNHPPPVGFGLTIWVLLALIALMLAIGFGATWLIVHD